jgi:hypothetical protein
MADFLQGVHWPTGPPVSAEIPFLTGLWQLGTYRWWVWSIWSPQPLQPVMTSTFHRSIYGPTQVKEPGVNGTKGLKPSLGVLLHWETGLILAQWLEGILPLCT